MLNECYIAEKVEQYFRRQHKLNLAAKLFLEQFFSAFPQSVVFGGMIRDFSLGLAEEFSSDIDIVVYQSRQDIYNYIQKFQPGQNKFGGFRFLVGSQAFDIWSFEDTWAFREGIVRGEQLRDLCATTFFNLDAAILHFGSWKVESAPKYKDHITSRLLDINLAENPDNARSAIRAVAMSTQKHLLMTPRLGAFVLRHFPLHRNNISPSIREYLCLLTRYLESGSNIPFDYRLHLASSHPKERKWKTYLDLRKLTVASGLYVKT